MNKPVEKNLRELEARRKAPLATRTDLSAAAHERRRRCGERNPGRRLRFT